ncbi:unnamed protein product [Aspergillus oryzae]|uniref:Unnamed protein product n=1 Tax=Aspergillus oryzae var. brunneus TaxID=332754 RepID=A0ABQ6KDP4_ASPOZ|nr:unnamed protein product [Aspergillus oryzae]GMF86396.1 unnamed protein product [Aspergillus oryzae]GMG02694.1 unnamed protein product [Aspergillus oryzae]GMG40943.1 unnamed protein product [Aspergillus oryzae var. brunneus]
MESIPESQSSNPVEDSQAEPDNRTIASILNGSLVSRPPKKAVPIFSYTWMHYQPPPMPSYYDELPADWKKNNMCTELSGLRGYAYLQIDTCFIANGPHVVPREDMDSIMYSWYENAAACLVYLRSVKYTDHVIEFKRQFKDDPWLTEPWALQELLASRKIIFYSQEGRCFLGATKETLLLFLSEETGIVGEVLANYKLVKKACIAMRLSWAATRDDATVDVVKSEPDPRSRDTILADSLKDFASCFALEVLPVESPIRVYNACDESALTNIPRIDMGDHNYLLYLHCYESRSTLMPPEEQEPQFDPLDRAMAISVKYNLLTTQYQRADVTETQVWPGEKIMRSFIVHTTGYLHAY